MFGLLGALRWQVLRIRLRNIRNTFAREHPLAIFEAVLRGAAGGQSPPPGEPWFFHPLEPVGERIRVEHDYPLEVVFPRSGPDAVEDFADRLGQYLSDSKRNFVLLDRAGPQTRGLAQLEMESAELETAAEKELCLEFLTPLAFRPADPSRRWHITAATLLGGIAKRVESLWGVRLEWSSEALRGIEALPCFWRYVEHRHKSKSSGGFQWLNGCVGPLYLKGNLRPWLPLLRIGAQTHVAATDGRGERLAFGAGAYQLHARRSFFAGALFNPQTWREAMAVLAAEDPEPDSFLHGLDSDSALQQLIFEIRSGSWQPETALGFQLKKKVRSERSHFGPAGTLRQESHGVGGNNPGIGQPENPAAEGGSLMQKPSNRLLCQFPSRDRLVHRVLHQMLAPVWDRLFETSSHGFRAGRSVASARKAVLAHVRAGCRWVLEADIATFFDEIDWTLLEERLDRALPEGDTVLREILRRVIRGSLTVDGQTMPRGRGLLQGCALSPLLANLFLDPFDEEATAAGLRMVRYADDFLLMCRDEVEGARACDAIVALLSRHRLRLNLEKVALTPVAAGFQFLGQSFASELDEDFLERNTLRKPLHVLPDYSFVGVEAGALSLRRDRNLAGRVPLRRLSEITLLGSHCVSTPLLQRCAELGVPVSFCSPAGHHYGTLRPDSRRHFETAGMHYQRHRQLAPQEVTRIAANIVTAKIGNYLAWVRESSGAAHLAEHLDRLLAAAAKALDVDVLRGLEGDAARHLFRWVNDHVREPEFASRQREPRRKADPWNSLLDFAYTRLFTRLNVLLRNRGLNPYLGWLHSAGDDFESLVCDLQEPFRARCDRWALRLVNRCQVRPDDFAPHSYGGLRLTSQAIGRLLEIWEREMDTRVASDPGTFEQLLHAQTDAVLAWVNGAPHLRLFRAPGHRLPAAWNTSVGQPT